MASALDAELIARAAAGDLEAIGAMYDRHAALLMGVAVRILGTSSEAEDALHDMFVRLPERAKSYSAERGTAITWLIALVRNVSIDRLRRRGVAERHARVATATERPGGSQPHDPEAASLESSQRHRVRAALASLPPTQRATLEAAFFEGLTYAQVAEREGVPIGTIKSRCSRAIAILREKLKGESFITDE